MKFRTEITLPPLGRRIDHRTQILALGSCFAENISARLRRAKFSVTTNPLGVLFNPASIAQSIGRFACGEEPREEELQHADERWFSFGAHSSLACRTRRQAHEALTEALNTGARALAGADCLIITFGTAWVYSLAATGEVVANCHKQPQGMFRRRRLTVGEIAAVWRQLLDGPLAGKHIIITVSPVRHLGDGLAGNAASKAVLRLAAEMLAEEYGTVDYFPAFEIVNDDLRDYRFYADDLVHPSEAAVDYIWEKFAECALTAEAQAALPRIEQIVAAARHRPFDSESSGYTDFCRRMMAAADTLPYVDFREEREIFGRHTGGIIEKKE